MSLPQVVSREEWLEARRALLVREKEVTRARDALNAERRRLPMVRVGERYEFAGVDGVVGLADLFEGRRQLIVYHFMFDPGWEAGCRSCSAWADNVGNLAHLRAHNTTLALVSRAPFGKIEAFKARMGWELPWYSSYGSDFNYDFQVTMDEAVAPVEYNYRGKQAYLKAGEPWHTEGEQPGLSAFLREEDEVFHTYSAYARGLEQTGGTHYFLDLTALGRQQGWEEPRGRAPDTAIRLRYHDEYGSQ